MVIMTLSNLLRSMMVTTLLPTLASAHSWLDCVHYECSTPAPSDPADCTCTGFPRNWASTPAEPFARDVGRDIRPGASPANGGLFCDPAKEPNPGSGSVAALYSDAHPMATLSQGQVVRMRWPAKNHATVGIQRGVQVYLSTVPGQGDVFPTAATAADIYAEMDYSNCNPRQANVDNADCQDEFTIKSTTAPGRYTMMWWWEFNEGEFYNSCADVEIVAAAGGGGADAGGEGDEGGEGGEGGSAPSPPPKLPAIGVLYGECQTNLDQHQLASPNMADPDAYCVEEAATVSLQYGQLAELDGRYDFGAWGAISSCAEFFGLMEEVCAEMGAIAAQGVSVGAQGGVGNVGSGFLGFFLGLVAGALLIKVVVPQLCAPARPAPPPPPPPPCPDAPPGSKFVQITPANHA